MPIRAFDKHIGGLVIRARNGDRIESRWDPHHHVAETGLQRVSKKRFSFRPPDVLQFGLEMGGHQFRDAILQTFTRLIREGKIVGIRADA